MLAGTETNDSGIMSVTMSARRMRVAVGERGPCRGRE